MCASCDGARTCRHHAAGRLAAITHLSGQNTVASFTYSPDAAGNPLSVAEVMSLIPGGTTTYTYDALSRLRTATYPDGTWSTYTYDPMGNRTQLDTQGGTTTSPENISWPTCPSSRFSSIMVSLGDMGDYAYNGEGVRISKTVGGLTTSYLQDQVGGLPRVLQFKEKGGARHQAPPSN